MSEIKYWLDYYILFEKEFNSNNIQSVEDTYIYKLQQQLKQRDEVIDEIFEYLDKVDYELDTRNDLTTYIFKAWAIIAKYKGDNNE